MPEEFPPSEKIDCCGISLGETGLDSSYPTAVNLSGGIFAFSKKNLKTFSARNVDSSQFEGNPPVFMGNYQYALQFYFFCVESGGTINIKNIIIHLIDKEFVYFVHLFCDE